MHEREPTIAVIGGSGFYGRYLVDDLLAHTGARVVVVNRSGRRSHGWGDRVSVRAANMFDHAALRRALDGVDVVAHAAGPFELLPLGPLALALELGLAYADISENRRWAATAEEMIARRRPAAPVFVGASVTPALVTTLVRWVATRLDAVERVRTIAAPDTRRHRGAGMFRTMLYGAGRPYPQPRDGTTVTVHGWTEPEWYPFPDPIGRRLVHLVYGMAELDEVPRRFGAHRRVQGRQRDGLAQPPARNCRARPPPRSRAGAGAAAGAGAGHVMAHRPVRHRCGRGGGRCRGPGRRTPAP